MRTTAFTTFLLLTVAGLAPAQTAAVRDHAGPCPPPSGPACTITSTPPIRGETTTITTYGAPRGSAALLIAATANYQGIHLSPFGSPGCLLYASVHTGVAVPLSLPLFGGAPFRFTIPAHTALGTQFFAQSVITDGGPAGWNLLTSNLIVGTVGVEPDLTEAQIAAFAPVLRLHPAEAYHPMDPLLFVQLARFRHHRGWASDQGYNKRTGAWVTTDSHAAEYYDVPVSVVNGYGLNPDGSNRRPRDANSGSSWNVFLQPRGAPTGHAYPSGVVPAFYHYRRSGGVHEIQYWWFFGYNDSVATFNHQGDWEHVTVQVTSGNIVGVYYAAHEGGEYRTVPQIAFANGRPVVYVARGSHAAYATPGTHFFGADETADGGYQWDISHRLDRLDSQPWRDYAGAWGEVGALATTTGPLGPWFKRDNR